MVYEPGQHVGEIDDEDEIGELSRAGSPRTTRSAISGVDAAELEARPELVRPTSVRPPLTGGRVRLVEIEGIDLQACGSTRVRSTAEVGALGVGTAAEGPLDSRFTLLD